MKRDELVALILTYGQEAEFIAQGATNWTRNIALEVRQGTREVMIVGRDDDEQEPQ